MAQRRIVKTGYNYTQGFSWASAGCILDKPEIKPQIPLCMYYDTRRVLSFLLAWRQFPLFNGMSGRSGRWLAFGVDRMRSELGIRAERVRLPVYRQGKVNPTKWPDKEDISSLVLLERLGIVECHHLGKTTPAWPTYNDLEQLRLDAAMLPAELGGGPDGYFHRHSFQTSSLFYRLADWLALSESDQLFNPFLLTFESGLKQAGSNLSHTLNGQSNSTQASPRSDSSLHGDAWSGKDGSKQQKPGLIEIAYSKAEGTQIPEEPSFPDNLLPQAQPIYQLLRHAHYSLTGYNGSGMSEVKAVELANRWIGQELSFEQASVIIHRLTSDWNSARNNIYSPIGVLIKRLEVALSLPALRTPDKPLPPTTSQTFSYSGNEARRPAFLNTFGRRRHHPFMPNHSSYSIKPFGREKSVGVGISPEQSAQTEPLEAYNPYQDVQSREKYCSGSSGFTGNEIELDKIWQQTLEKLAVNLPPMKFQLLDASRLELFLANELHPVLKLNRQWQLSQLGEVDLSIIRLTLRRFLGEQAWKLSFTSMESE